GAVTIADNSVLGVPAQTSADDSTPECSRIGVEGPLERRHRTAADVGTREVLDAKFRTHVTDERPVGVELVRTLYGTLARDERPRRTVKVVGLHNRPDAREGVPAVHR